MNHQLLSFRALGLALLLSAAAVMPVWAASHHGAHGAHGAHGQPTVPAGTADMTEGEVRKVDKEGGKLTLRHGEIKSLDMPAMTMVFVVKDKAMLDQVKAGDKIRFKAVDDGGKYTVTEMQVVQ